MALTEVNSLGIKDGEVKTADIAADAVTGAKIADDQIDSEHYVDGSIDTAHIADDAVTLAKLASGTDGQIISWDASGNPVAIGPGSDGQVLTSTGAGSPPAFEAASGGISDVVSDTSPQLGGDLETNGHNILLGDSSNGADDDVIRCGAGQDLNIYHNGTDSYIVNKTGNLVVYAKHAENGIIVKPDGAVELYQDNAISINTQADGARVTGGQYTSEIELYTNDGTQRGQIYATNGNDFVFKAGHGDTFMHYKYDAAVELFHNNTKTVETNAAGIKFIDGKGLTLGTDDDFTVVHNSADCTFLMTPAGHVNFNFDGNDATTAIPLRIQKTGDATNSVRHSMFSFGLPGTNNGVAQCGSSVSEAPIWGASSDYRIKENFRAYTGGWDAIKAIPVQLYDEKSPSYIKGVDKKDRKGWRAHEVQALIP